MRIQYQSPGRAVTPVKRSEARLLQYYSIRTGPDLLTVANVTVIFGGRPKTSPGRLSLARKMPGCLNQAAGDNGGHNQQTNSQHCLLQQYQLALVILASPAMRISAQNSLLQRIQLTEHCSSIKNLGRQQWRRE